MGLRSSKIVSATGSKTKRADLALALPPAADDALKVRADPTRPKGAQLSYLDKSRIATYDSGIYASGRRAKPHGYLSSGGSRVIRTGSSDVVRPISGPSLF